MIKNILKNKILISILVVSIAILSILFVAIPQLTEKNTIDLIAKNSITNAEQIKLTRAYYVQSVVKDIKEYAPHIKFDYDHHGVNGVLPFPTSTIHDLSKIFSANTNVQFRFYSEFPFKPKANRVLDEKQKEILKFTQNNKDGIYIAADTINGQPVVRVAVTDFMTDQSCVDCHNNHKDRTWTKDWKLGDRRGVLEIITPLEEPLAANNIMKNKILSYVGGSLLLLIVYYSWMLYKRENELLVENEALNKKIEEEVAKNIQKEKQIILQNRSAALGDMMAAIIHQWKQPLNGISMANSSLKLQGELGILDSNEINKQVVTIDNQITNMNDTMNDFKDFFKPKNQSCYNVNDSISQVLRIIGKVYEIQKINLVLHLGEDCYTQGYPNELNQVIINILNNARDVILEKNTKIKDVIITTTKNDEGVIITIEDLAGGIPVNIIDTIFEPYVTTKDEMHGTGIGLDMSKTIIAKVDGKIDAENYVTKVDNEEITGARFIIQLKSC